MTDSISDKLEPIRHSVAIAVPIDHLWQVLTGPATVSQWLGCLAYDGQVGHTFYMQSDPAKRVANDLSGATHCDLETLEAPHRFVFSWYMPGTPKTHVSFTLTAISTTSTQVELVHDGWDQFPAEMVRGIRDMLDGGWSSAVLPGLARAALS